MINGRGAEQLDTANDNTLHDAPYSRQRQIISQAWHFDPIFIVNVERVRSLFKFSIRFEICQAPFEIQSDMGI